MSPVRPGVSSGKLSRIVLLASRDVGLESYATFSTLYVWQTFVLAMSYMVLVQIELQDFVVTFTDARSRLSTNTGLSLGLASTLSPLYPPSAFPPPRYPLPTTIQHLHISEQQRKDPQR
jgi:hypothetical protein